MIRFVLLLTFGLSFAEGQLLGSSRCKPNEFPCLNGQCIKRSKWCDKTGSLDCIDQSDEIFCLRGTHLNEDPNECKDEPLMFLCRDGTCIPIVGRCDGAYDCPDNSDEKNCTVDDYRNNKELPEPVQAERIQNRPLYNYRYDTNSYKDLPYEDYRLKLSSAREWLKSQQRKDHGWGDYTARAVISMYLSREDVFPKTEDDLLMDKQLDIELLVALTRNETNTMSLSELALYINSLLAACKNPRNFYGYDLVSILRDRANKVYSTITFVSPLVHLTLCLGNATEHRDVQSLQDILKKDQNISKKDQNISKKDQNISKKDQNISKKDQNISKKDQNISKKDQNISKKDQNILKVDIISLAVLASSCIIKNPLYSHTQYRGNFVRVLLDKIRGSGLPGNIYELSLAMQALNEANVDPREWERDVAIDSILKKQNENGSFGDILGTYYTIPILSGKSLLSLSNHCAKDFSNGKTPLAILKNTKRRKISVTYSLYFGDPMEMSQKVTLQVAEGTTFLDVMRLAEEENPNFRFSLDETKHVPFVYSIGGMPNDAERGLYWTLHVQNTRNPLGSIPYGHDIKELVPDDGGEIRFWLKQI